MNQFPITFTNRDNNVLAPSNNSSNDLSHLPFHTSQHVHVSLENNSGQATKTTKILHNNCFNNYDRSHLSEIDPDNNYINNNNVLPDTKYFDEKSFKLNFQKNNNFSIFLHNMRSLPDHFRELTCYLDTIDFDFKVLALTETWLKSYHTNYTIPNYTIEQDNREHNRGGGVCLYMHSNLQYKLRNDLKLTHNLIPKHSKREKNVNKSINK